jgi:hypothetical protein
MADSKITALTSISTSTDPAVDPLVIVDVSDTSMAATGTTKKATLNQLLGAGGTATLASATITGDLTVGTNKLAVTSTGVGVGTASPAVAFHVLGAASATVEIAKIGASSGPYVGIGTEGTNYSWIQAFGGAPLRINPQGNDTILNPSSGNVGVGVAPAGTGGCLQLKSGITFPATQVASADANTLDDYEEGTWTPTLTFATPGTLAVTYGVRTGNYTKVGNLVTARFKIEINPAGFVKGTASGGVKITGLPFTASGTGTQYVDLAASLTDQTSGSLAICYPSSTDIFFEQTQVTGTRVIRSSAAIDASNFAATNTGYISLTTVLTYTV